MIKTCLLASLQLLVILACTTPSTKNLRAKNTQKSQNLQEVLSCEDANYECPPHQMEAPYLCSAYYEADRVLAWGPTACKAKRSLYQKACKNGVAIGQLKKLSCIPDPSRGECPVVRQPCTMEFKPTTCRATQYDGRKLSWDLMPTAWGSNACQARQKLQEEACHNGLVPSLMGEIACEADQSEGACPPKRDCDESETEPVVCTVETYGETKLEKPWTIFAPSKCQAMHQIQLLACRFANQENQLKPSLLGAIECEAPSKD
ncbi:MAG: hypothetical protein ACOH5I_24640 [Oligoflexus sp.]